MSGDDARVVEMQGLLADARDALRSGGLIKPTVLLRHIDAALAGEVSNVAQQDGDDARTEWWRIRGLLDDARNIIDRYLIGRAEKHDLRQLTYRLAAPTTCAPVVQQHGGIRFRKKPVVIEAMQFDGTVSGGNLICRWANDARGEGEDDWFSFVTDGIAAEDAICHTLEGDMTVSPSDFVIRGVKGEFYPCKPDIFALTYENADDAPKRRFPEGWSLVPTEPTKRMTCEAFIRATEVAPDGWTLGSSDSQEFFAAIYRHMLKTAPDAVESEGRGQ